MARFLSPLIVRDDDGLPLTLVAPLTYESDALLVFDHKSATLSRALTVPSGFQTDLASIPRPLWNVLPPIGKYDRAAVVHDWLYRWGQADRATADRVFLEAMTVLGVSWLTRHVIYAGVRAGGWKPWNRYRSQSEPEQAA